MNQTGVRFSWLLVATAVAVLAGVSGSALAVRDPGNANGEITMSSPSQRIHFNLQENSVEYDNYDYPEGAGHLHYLTSVTCFTVNPANRDAHFTFQIPEGHPGLSGVYVEAYVRVNDALTKNYTYGHTSTADLATAMAWCDPGNTAVPPTYPVTKGVLYVKPS